VPDLNNGAFWGARLLIDGLGFDIFDTGVGVLLSLSLSILGGWFVQFGGRKGERERESVCVDSKVEWMMNSNIHIHIQLCP
jgi:hypothetical protein